jgi:DNA-binding PadR family transcriptional regulator
MARSELTPFSYVVLALVGDDGAGPHDIVRRLRDDPLWTAADSHLYAEPKRLAGLGLLRAERRPGRTRERTHYTLTNRGVEALREWAAAPAAFPRIQHEAALRVALSGAVDGTVLAAGMAGLRGELDEISARIDEADRAGAGATAGARLGRALARRLVAVHRDWADEVERTLGRPPAPAPPPAEPVPPPQAPRPKVWRSGFVD